MNAEERIDLLIRLGEYIVSDDQQWASLKEKAHLENGWFIPEFIDYQLNHIHDEYLAEDKLRQWLDRYPLPADDSPTNAGIVMAGNIPLAGFHDLLCGFVSGRRMTVKPSSKDLVLISGIVNRLCEWRPELQQRIVFADQLKGCDAYIATGSNNSARYFDYYFSKYPSVIRKNRSSAAILDGSETVDELSALADDVCLYYGLGCRNVTKIYVPQNYDFLPLLESFKRYDWLADNHKYKNNYDYQLAIMIINKIYYMTNGSILLRENKSLFSPVSQLNYEFYSPGMPVDEHLVQNPEVQCIVAKNRTPFGTAQKPALDDYADKADTLQFLLGL